MKKEKVDKKDRRLSNEKIILDIFEEVWNHGEGKVIVSVSQGSENIHIKKEMHTRGT